MWGWLEKNKLPDKATIRAQSACPLLSLVIGYPALTNGIKNKHYQRVTHGRMYSGGGGCKRGRVPLPDFESQFPPPPPQNLKKKKKKNISRL